MGDYRGKDKQVQHRGFLNSKTTQYGSIRVDTRQHTHRDHSTPTLAPAPT